MSTGRWVLVTFLLPVYFQANKTYEVVTYVAPVLPTTSGDITVDQGQTATFSCENTAVPLPKVQWTKNGRPLNLDDLVGNARITSFLCLLGNGQ